MEKPHKKLPDRLHFVFLMFFMSATLMLLIGVVVSVYISRIEKTMEESIQNHLLAAARAASKFLTAEELDLFHAGVDMDKPEWGAIRAKLQQFAEDYNVLYVYYWRYTGDGRIQYIIDNDEDEEWMVTPELFFDVNEDPVTAAAVPYIIAGNAWVSDLGTYTTSWDSLISGLAPVFNADGSVYCAAGVDLSDEIILSNRNNVRVMRIVLILSLTLSILSGCMGMWLYRRKALQSEQASMAKSEFLSTMSHEIRTPLNAVIGLSEIVLNRGSLLADSRNDIQQIRQSGTSLLGIVNDILDFSKIEARGFELVPVEYNTASFLHDTINLNRIRIGSKPITFILELDGNFPRRLRGDELRVKQILSNILSNAIKYTQEGSVTLSAVWENAFHKEDSALSEARLRFTIRDTGIGIHPDNIEKLFNKYAQFDTASNRKIEGTGLGLTITKKLVEMMKGSITVESEYGKGSVFTVTLVQELEDAAGIGKETAQALRLFQFEDIEREEEVERAWMPYGKVLIVDDLPVNIYIAQGLLEPYGLQIDMALSGQEAIDKVRAEKYDLIFMDQMMPEMDGIETVRLIRAWEQKEGRGENPIPIIALTADALVGSMEMFLYKGFNGFISKPIDIVQLDKALNLWIRDKQSQET